MENYRNTYHRNKYPEHFYRELEAQYRRGFEHGYNEGYTNGYEHAREDHYLDHAEREWRDEPCPVNLNPKTKWHGKRSLSWTWV